MGEEKRAPYIINSKEAHRDERGYIANYFLPEPISMIGDIESNLPEGEGRFCVRANHYHPKQEQKVLVVKGSYISLWRPLDEPEGEIRHHVVRSGDLEVMPANVVHAMIFLEDSRILNLVAGDRDTEKFEEHTIRKTLVDPERDKDFVDKLITHYSGRE